MDDVNENMNIEIIRMHTQMVKLRDEMGDVLLSDEMGTLLIVEINTHCEQLKALQRNVLLAFIRNVTSTILFAFAGNKPHKFCNAEEPFLSRITEYVKGTNWNIIKFLITADLFIKYNRILHPVSVQELDELVTRAKNAINTCPGIATDSKNERIILYDYNNMKKLFPYNGEIEGKKVALYCESP
jgi:predicted RNA methylase